MGLRIGTNVSSLRAQQTLTGVKKNMEQAMSRLSSGSRINKAADDAVGLAHSENFKSQLRGLNQSSRNAQDGISMIQIAEGGLNEVSNMVVRLRELSIQAASDTIGDRERAMVNNEYSQILSEIDRVSEATQYNGTKLLAGLGDKIDIQINTRNSDSMDRVSYDPSEANASTRALNLDMTGTLTKEQARQSLENLDNAIAKISSLRAGMGAMQGRLQSTVESILESTENVSTANSRIRDADIAVESAELAKQNVLQQTGVAVLAQTNQQGNLALSLLNKG